MHGIACSTYTPTHTGVRTQGYTPTRTRVHAPVLVYVRAQARASPMILSYHRWEVMGLGKIVNICPTSLIDPSVGLIVPSTIPPSLFVLSTTSTRHYLYLPPWLLLCFSSAWSGRTSYLPAPLSRLFLCFFPLFSARSALFWVFVRFFCPFSLKNRVFWVTFLHYRPFGCIFAYIRADRAC